MSNLPSTALPATLVASLAPSASPASGDRVASFVARAMERAASLPWPSRSDEDWKYTDASGFQTALTRRAASPARPELPSIPEMGPEAARLVFVDGRLDPSLSLLPTHAGLTLHPRLADAPDVAQQAALQELEQLLEPDADRLSALLAATAPDACILHVAKNVEVNEPLHLVHVHTSDSQEAAGMGAFVLLAEASSRVGVIQTFVGASNTSGASLFALLASVAPNAQVDAVRLILLPEDVHSLDRKRVRLDRDARFHSFVLGIGAGVSRDDLRVRVDAPGAFTGLFALSAVRGHQLSDHHTLIDHRSADTSSEQIYRAIGDGHGHIVFNGRVFIHQDAQRVAAEQLNRTLMLSPNARVDAKPQLEIFADDVRCGHGATIGQLDPEDIFYLHSRGIAPAVARALLIRGFANDLIERVPIDGVRDRFESLFQRWFLDSEEVAS